MDGAHQRLQVSGIQEAIHIKPPTNNMYNEDLVGGLGAVYTDKCPKAPPLVDSACPNPMQQSLLNCIKFL
jgi:hypothetical protein